MIDRQKINGFLTGLYWQDSAINNANVLMIVTYDAVLEVWAEKK